MDLIWRCFRMETKTCCKCGKEYPITDFYPSGKGLNKRRGVCKYCRREEGREYHKRTYVSIKKPLPEEFKHAMKESIENYGYCMFSLPTLYNQNKETFSSIGYEKERFMKSAAPRYLRENGYKKYNNKRWCKV